MTIQHLRSSTANKRPTPAAMSDGQIAVNTNTASPGLFFKDSAGALIKVGPVHVGTTAPNASPASGGETGNTVGEQWLDTTGGTYVFKVWDGSAWRSESGTFVDVNGDVMTGALGIIAGSAGSPGLYFSGDTNTGLYSPGSDQLALATGGTGRLFVDASGNVGIGGAPTLSRLTVTDATASTTIDGGSIETTRSDGFYIQSPNNTRFYTAGSERLRITSAGLVGIGTSSPGQNITVQSSASGTAPTFKLQNPIDSNSSQGAANNLSAGQLLFGATGSYPLTAKIESVYNADASFGRSAKLIFSGANGSGTLTERLTIDESGRVGIGTSTPGERLTVVGTDNSANFRVKGSSSSGDFFIYNNASTNQVALSTNLTTTDMAFAIGGNEAMKIDTSRRLLVGTSSGSGNNLLQIQGEAGSSAGIGGIVLRRGLAPSLLGSGSIMGRIDFGPNDGGVGASIIGEGDAQQGTSDYPSRLVFSTTADGASSPTERMRIGSGGEISAFAPESSIIAHSNSNAATTHVLFQGRYSATTGSLFSGTASFQVYTNGNVQNTNNSYGAISDIKLKENIVDAASQWGDIKALQVRKYNFKEGQTHTQIGLVAQEVELVSPGLVSESPDRDADGNDLGTVTKSVNYSVLYMKAVKALQEAMERIEVLEQRLTDAGIA